MRGRWSAGLARAYRVSDRSTSERYIGTWSNDASAALGHPKPSMQSVTCSVKHEWPEIALFYAVARLANDVTHAPARLVTPDLAMHARGLLAPRPNDEQRATAGRRREARRLIVAWSGGARARKHQSSSLSLRARSIANVQLPQTRRCRTELRFCFNADAGAAMFRPCDHAAQAQAHRHAPGQPLQLSPA